MYELFHCGYPKEDVKLKVMEQYSWKISYTISLVLVKYDRLKMNADDICAKDIENSSTLNRPVTLTLGGIIGSCQTELKVLDLVYYV